MKTLYFYSCFLCWLSAVEKTKKVLSAQAPTTSSNIVASTDKSVGSMNIFGSSSTSGSTVLSSFDIESLLSPSSESTFLGDDDATSDIIITSVHQQVPIEKCKRR